MVDLVYCVYRVYKTARKGESEKGKQRKMRETSSFLPQRLDQVTEKT